MIQNGGTETPFNFGDHVYGVTYPPPFMNTDGTQMTVNAIPIDQTVFFNTRLKNNTLFNNEQCVRYFSTGDNNCIVYEVTCQNAQNQTIPCPNPFDHNNNELQIATRTSYSSPDNVNADNADYIKAPIGTNTWCSIFTSFQQDDIDPTTSGHGNNFSDFVATFKTSPGQDPACPPPPGNARNMFRKPPQINAAAPASNSHQESGPAGGNK
jgi:hypothetical protein